MKKRIKFQTKYLHKLFLLLLTTILSIFIIMGAINYASIKTHTTEQFHSANRHSHALANNYLQNTMSNLESLAKKISLEKETLFATGTEVDSYLLNFLSISPIEVKNIYFLRQDGIYSSASLLFSTYGNEPMIEALTEEMPIHLHWGAPYRSQISGFVMPLLFRISNMDHTQEGVLLIELNLSYLKVFMTQLYYDTGLFYQLIYTQGDDVTPLVWDGQENIVTSLRQLREYGKKEYVLSQTQTEAHYVSNISPSFHLLSTASFVRVDKELFSVRYNLFLSIAALVVLALVFSFYLSYRLSKPLHEIASKMREIDQFDDKNLASLKIQKQYSNEFQEVAESFNYMVGKIEHLLAEQEKNLLQKRKYEIKALQNQIAPHFLHNTLICISNLFQTGQLQSARIAMKTLIQLLSYSFQSGNDTVPLGEELAMIEKFVLLLQLRYSTEITFNTKVPPEMKSMQVPKLCLQPFVENSVFHGIIPKGTPGVVRITGTVTPDQYLLEIYDNGVGTDISVEDLLEKDKSVQKSYKHNSIGITNTYQRLRLYYGEEFTVKLVSQEGEFTNVILNFGKPITTENSIDQGFV